MDIRKVKKLIEMLEASDLEEIEIQEGEESVRLVKKQTLDSTPTKENASDSEGQQEKQPEKEILPSTEEGEAILSPMVGTFYAAASPGAKPFVSVGETIQEGDVVCIIEAMKMMNEIKSDFTGKITSVLVENSDPVEFGQKLFLIS